MTLDDSFDATALSQEQAGPDSQPNSQPSFRQLRFGDTPDLLWLACVGVTDAYLHGRLDVAGYGAVALDLRRHAGRLFPNGAVDRAGRTVYAEELESGERNHDGHLTR